MGKKFIEKFRSDGIKGNVKENEKKMKNNFI